MAALTGLPATHGAAVARKSAGAWQSIRLELADTPDFPRGSAGRVYLLRLPLDADGAIDEAEVAHLPARATVRRFWPSQADLSGNVVKTPQGWAFVYDEEKPAAVIPQPAAPVLRLGGRILLAEPDGSRLCFRVASVASFS